jgi:hypothetical protein
MTTQDTSTVEIRDHAYGTIHFFGWDWPDEVLLADFVEKNDRVEQTEQPIEDSSEYAILYFVS